MRKKVILLGIIIITLIITIVCICIINKNKDKNNDVIVQSENGLKANDENFKSLLEFPIPNSIIFHYDGIKKEILSGTKEFENIIELNNKRDKEELGTLQLVIDLEDIMKKNNILEYTYEDYGSIYFNLIGDKELNDNDIAVNWVLVDINIFKNSIYGGLLSADELNNYLYSLK